MRKLLPLSLLFFANLLIISSCNNKDKASNLSMNTLDLKRGEIISCGPQDGEMFGTVSFTSSISKNLQTDFNIGVALLHSFEYDEAEKMFAKVIDECPDCAMAYWGVAMSNFHSLWTPPTEEELKKGERAVKIGRSIKNKSKREAEYIDAIGTFYDNYSQYSHQERVLKLENAMANIYKKYPQDAEAAIFYALTLNASADPKDKTYKNQRKAIGILNTLFQNKPLHPGVAHYIIHNSDYPALAELGLAAARKYASIAPSSAHAQHMPSHIFTRLGLWDECIQSNLVSVSSAKCYAEKAKLKGHWDEELHGLDYLMYGYLQKGADEKATEQLAYLKSINEVSPVTFKTAYAFAAIPARYFLEKKMWKEAAQMQIHPTKYPWEKFPWQKAIYNYARLLGSVNTGMLDEAKTQLRELESLYALLNKQKDKSKEAAQVAVQMKSGEAWLAFKQGNTDKGLQLMKDAADMEDAMEKHPVTPGEIIPARELLGEMLLQMDKPDLALQAFEADLKNHQNRFNGLYSAGVAASKLGDKEKANRFFKQLLNITDANSQRPEVENAKSYLNQHSVASQ